ncbi:unnamed protein product [Didymodactylos carnosus]|nr:unnamed protein product [Didymodactylos carnosus]CAF4015651.1 unnamed protein product [Didymodactylos carnosus]
MADIYTSATDELTGRFLSQQQWSPVYRYQQWPVLQQLRQLATSQNAQPIALHPPMQQIHNEINNRAGDAMPIYQKVAAIYRTNGVLPLVTGLIQKKERNQRR